MIERSRELVEERYSISNGHKYNAKVGMAVLCTCCLYQVCYNLKMGSLRGHWPVIERFT